MLRLRALVLERDARAVLRDWGKAGVVQLTRTAPGPDAAPLPPRDRSGELARCNHLRSRVEELRRSLELPSHPHTKLCRICDKVSSSALADAGEGLCKLEARALDLLQRRQQLTARLAELAATCERLSPYLGLDVPLDGLDRFTFLHFASGSLPAENWSRLQQQAGEGAALLPLPQQNKRQPLIVMTTQRNWPALGRVLREAGFQSEPLPEAAGTTTDSLSERSRREREEQVAELAQVNAALRNLAVECAGPLDEIERLADTERRLLEAGLHFPRTEAAVLLTGWIPESDAPSMRGRLLEITGGRCVVEAGTPAGLPDEDIPVLQRHPGWLRPFGMLVRAYGLPKYHELEPTLFVAISYVLMFGVMFGDVGHGAVLALGGLTAWLTARAKNLRDAGLLLLFGGLSSMTCGWVYGSCFGLESFKRFALWRDPLEGDPASLMSGAIGIGVVMISLGLVLNIINRLRRGDVVGGCLDKFGLVGLLFYWGALALILKSAAIQSRGMTSLAIAVFLGLPLVGWALKEPLEYFISRRAGRAVGPGAGLFAALTESLVGAFEAVLSYLANTISFVRLAAYAMSHAALLAAAFTMAEEVKHISVGGGALAVLVIVLGNVAAIVLEGVIASVQALRLEYYEFFGKFFSGGGRPFTPFRLAET
jgi:V/A-type H+-transporting ATPase subunit I